MTWCNDSDEERGNNELLSSPSITPKANNNNNNTDVTDIKLTEEIRTIKCPSCGHNIEVKDQVLKINYIKVSIWFPSLVCLICAFIY